jgi:hypothetical protein
VPQCQLPWSRTPVGEGAEEKEGHRGPCVSVKGDELLLGACVMKFNGGVIDCTRPRLKIEFDDIFMSGSVKGDK